MSPIQEHIGVPRRFDDEKLKIDPEDFEKRAEDKVPTHLSPITLKIKLEETLRSAKVLAETLKTQIDDLANRENLLKDAITNGRPGVSTLTVSTMSQVPRSYIIRNGRWSLCNGMIQFPIPSQASSTNLFNGLFSEPRCIGREVPTVQDPCVFNSVIKYEVVPTVRAPEYTEDEYLCLKPTFNVTLERYMSVTRHVLNDTCKDGIIRSLGDNYLECGVRILSEYSFYPHKSSAASTLPLEYCVEKDGSCKLIMAWHIIWTFVHKPSQDERVKILARTVHALARFGDELYLESLPDCILLRTLNAAESAYAMVKFNKNFFSYFNYNYYSTEDNEGLKCKISMKSALNTFKSPTHIDKQVENLEIKLDPDSYALNNFQSSDDQVTLEATSMSLILRNYIDCSADLTKIIRTQISLKPAEFDSYMIGTETVITFSLKEFRALLTFSEALNLPLQLHFETTGRPAVFIVHNGTTFEAHFVLATTKPDNASQTTTTQNTNVERNKRKDTSGTQGSAKKKPHLETDISKCLDEDSHLFNFVDIPGDNEIILSNKLNGNHNINKDKTVNDLMDCDNIPASPAARTMIKSVFKRCFESTFDPRSIQGAVLAENSDSE
ncbi:hypothetical protein HW555_005514 [Spodoptera exigua]|uniref:Uncharacterized protein n=1 Tax=Spodoptera exigua TaxID=7107 RepID=A0A835GJI7_SPOEX|nr:hypothetical protein HW555_005514 [Spodoptera exigua]